MTMHVYIKSEPQLWTVGWYDPKGEWHPVQDCLTEDEARSATNYLNGGR